MIYIEHRRNQIKDLQTVHVQNGCEIDIRSDLRQNGRMHVSHNPWETGEDFDVWIKVFKERKIEGPLILNTKEDGLEPLLFQKMDEYGIQNYLFLDTALPTLVKYLIGGKGRHFMLRVSSYENYSTLKHFIGQIEWLWVDCFHQMPLPLEMIKTYSQMGFKLCLVSPELQAGNLQEAFHAFVPIARICSSICTKHFKLWESFLLSQEEKK